MNNDDTIVATAIARAKAEILADVARGVTPSTVRDFSTLHDYADANCYGGLCDGDWPGWTAPPVDADNTHAFDLATRIQNALHTWLRAEGIEAERAHRGDVTLTLTRAERALVLALIENRAPTVGYDERGALHAVRAKLTGEA